MIFILYIISNAKIKFNEKRIINMIYFFPLSRSKTFSDVNLDANGVTDSVPLLQRIYI